MAASQPGSASHPHLTIDPVTMRAGSPGKPPPSSQSRIDAYLGKTLEGRYAIEALLGEGGMGFVYLGRHKLIDKRVAIKILRGDLAADAEMTERFLNEARAASSIGNAHIVDISDFGRLPDGAAYFAMEFLDGQPLANISGNGRVVAVPRLVHIAKQIARGLGAAHSRGVVHRDLKPDNVMLIPRGDDPDFVKILDFGIAKLNGENAKLTRAGSVFGTPHYMSPEQAAGVPVDQRTDIYSLGVMIYEMACGRVPFDADNFMGILTQHMYKAPAPLRTVAMPGHDIPTGLEAVIVKALSKKPELRYQSMEEMVLDLEKLERGLAPDAFGEITSRSDEFNIPADYFQNAGIGGTGGSKKAMIWGAVAGVGVLALIIAAVVFTTQRKPPPITASTSDPTSAATDPVVAPSASVTAGVAMDLPPNKLGVVVTTDPVDAKISLDDDPNDTPQPQPRIVQVGNDEKLTLRIESPGYRTKKVTLDGKKLDPKNPRIVIKLNEDKGKAQPTSTRSPSTTKTAAPAPAPAPAPPPVSTNRPANCAVEDWDPYQHKCLKH